MFCPECGNQLPDNANFCGACGTSVPNTSENKVLHFFKEKIAAPVFTVATALLTAGASLGVFSGELPVVEILTVIGLWMLVSAAKGNKPLAGYKGGLTMARVAIQIERVFNWIAVVALAVSGLLIALLGTAAAQFIGSEEIFSDPEFSTYLGLLGGFDIADIGGVLFVVLGIVFVVLAVFVALLNVFMLGSFLKCALSFENSAKTGNLFIDKASAARGWIIFIGVLEGISAVGVFANVAFFLTAQNIFSFAGGICTAVALFMFASVLKREENIVDNF